MNPHPIGEAAARKIAVVDDDAKPFGFVDLPEIARATLADPNIAASRRIWALQNAINMRGAGQTTSHELARIATSDPFVRDVLLSDEFAQKCADLHLAWIEASLAAYKSKLAWLGSIRAFFKPPEFELTEFTSFPANIGDLLQYDFVIVDVVLDDSVDPVANVSGKLADLNRAAERALRDMPRLLLVSTRDDILRANWRRFRRLAQVSASALRIEAKNALGANTDTGVTKLGVLVKMMDDEREMATATRRFCLAWEQSMKSQQDKAMDRLWSLDCDALQRIFISASDGREPFFQHLMELLVRGINWDLQADSEVANRLNELTVALDARLGKDDAKPRRFSASPKPDRIPIRELAHRYHWLPTADSKAIQQMRPENGGANGPRVAEVLPFGVLLCKAAISDGAQVILHITPPCDVLDADKEWMTASAVFLRGRVTKEREKQDGARKISMEVLKDDTTLYVTFDCGHSIIETVGELIPKLRAAQWLIVGCLRHESARVVLSQYAAYLGRPDEAIFPLDEAVRFEVALVLKEGAKWFLVEDSDKRRLITGHKKKSAYDIEEAIDLAMWCKENHKAALGVAGAVDVFDLSTLLRNGFSTKNREETKVTDTLWMSVENGDENAGITHFKTRATNSNGAFLVFFVRK